MGWSFPWASSSGSDFSYDFQAAYTIEQQSGAADHNFRTIDMRPQLEADPDNPWLTALAGPVGTDWPTYRQEEPGVSAFALDEASSTTPTRRPSAVRRPVGQTSGSTARHAAATRPGSSERRPSRTAVTTNTTANQAETVGNDGSRYRGPGQS
jgi:hypothetical protein